MRFLNRKWHFVFFFPFYVGERQTEKKKNHGKLQKCAKKIVFWGWMGKSGFVKNVFFWENLQSTLCVQKVEKGHVRQHYLFWEDGPFCFVSHHKILQKQGFQHAQGKSEKKKKKNHHLLKKGVWEGVSKGFSVCDTHFIAVSAKHSSCKNSREQDGSSKKKPK